ncbi:hypothetical protein [Viridibacterium curvum]|uniref:Uncharacterized protein n=1 Tax=Viridibacterium curvum TaxID=1101404 RepID=A0ABP9R8E6_9RHOO
MHKRKTIFAVFFSVAVSVGHAADECKSGKGYVTEHGRFTQTHCHENGHPTRSFLRLDSLKLIEDAQLFLLTSDNSLQRFLYSGGLDRSVACPKNLYLIDISLAAPKVIAFGVEGACPEYHWASWGKKRSVIAIKSNVRFVYENGKLTPPPKDLALITTIEPPRTGSGIDEKKLQPFVREVSPPK